MKARLPIRRAARGGAYTRRMKRGLSARLVVPMRRSATRRNALLANTRARSSTGEEHLDPCQRDHPTFDRCFRHDAGVAASARLDRPALSRWCLKHLGWRPERVLFEAGYLSQVIGMRLANGQDVVVKVRAWHDRLVACGEVQQSLVVSGFPAAQLLVAPKQVGQLGVSAEALVHGGELLAAQEDSAARFAEALSRLVRAAPDASAVSPLAPSPAWVGWDHAAGKLWPDPDDRDGDLNAHPGDRWLDEIAAAAREQLLAGRPTRDHRAR